MDIAKKNKLIEWLTFAYLILFPFGQLIRINLNLSGRIVPLHPVDVIAGIFLLIFIFSRFKKPYFYQSIKNFLWVCLFSLVLSFALFKSTTAVFGGLYLLRFIAYLALNLVLWNLLQRKNSLRKTFFDSLIVVSLATGIFGWYQYLVYPDFRSLIYLGWDDHLFRLIGTFLDPGFTSLILVFGFILSLAKFYRTKDKRILILLGFFLFSIAFTYARAGYLALGAGVLLLSFLEKRVKFGIFLIFSFLVIILFLPRPFGEGVNLSRTFSINARFGSYAETLAIINKSPVFGIGFNNLCLAKEKYFETTDINSHSCSGADLNILGLLGMTGVIGTLVFMRMIWKMIERLGGIYREAFLICGVALAIHSFFVNSLFYPWVLGYMGILLAISQSGGKTDR